MTYTVKVEHELVVTPTSNSTAYDVVVSNYQGDDWPKETLQSLIDYVHNGGGFVVYHFACAAFPEWKEFDAASGDYRQNRRGWGIGRRGPQAQTPLSMRFIR